MMVLPSKEERNLRDKIEEWLRIINDDEPYFTFYLDSEAPDDVKKSYKEYMDKYLPKDAHWIPLEIEV